MSSYFSWLVKIFLVFSFVVILVACSPKSLPPVGITPPATSDGTQPTAILEGDQATALSSTVTVMAQTVRPETLPPPPTPTSGIAPLHPLTGVEVHNLDGINQIQNLNAYWVRRNALRWDWIEQQEGERNWENVAGMEREMIAISEQGMQMILIVQYAPLWAQEIYGYGCGPVKADKLAAYGAFMHDVVARYSAPPYNVRFYEMGNEPDVPFNLVPGGNQYGCWIDMNDPAYNADDYARMLQAVYPQVKAANPDAQLLVGGILMDCDPLDPPQQNDGTLKDCSSARFLELALQYGAAEYFDGVSFHAYDYYNGKLGQYSNSNWHSTWDSTGPTFVSKSRYLRALLDSYNRPDAYLLNTETALLCGKSGDEAVCFTDEFNQTKASYAAQANTLAQAEGLLGNIWFSIKGWRASGLLDAYGQPLPVYDAIRFNAQQLNGMAYAGQLVQFEGVFVYEFHREGQRLWVIWSQDGAEHSISLPSSPASAFDMLGNPLSPSQAWTVTLTPAYLVWQE